MSLVEWWKCEGPELIYSVSNLSVPLNPDGRYPHSAAPVCPVRKILTKRLMGWMLYRGACSREQWTQRPVEFFMRSLLITKPSRASVCQLPVLPLQRPSVWQTTAEQWANVSRHCWPVYRALTWEYSYRTVVRYIVLILICAQWMSCRRS